MQRIYKLTKISDPLQKYKITCNGINYNWDCFQNPLKREQKKYLIKEQGGICAYCMQIIDIQNNKIEHIKPRHFCSESEKLSHKNMLAVCKGISDSYKHCDTFRGDLQPKKQVMKINPTKKKHNYNKNIRFNDGKIQCTDSTINKEISEKLNLNCKNLVEKRQKAEEGYIEGLEIKGFDGSLKACRKELLRLTQRKIPLKKRRYDEFCLIKINIIKERISIIKANQN
jgi:uncharacterized protein (TIGR02646 family)